MHRINFCGNLTEKVKTIKHYITKSSVNKKVSPIFHLLFNKLKPKLIILSDLWGKAKSEWTANYTNELEKYFDISYCDCCKLGEIETSTYTEENLHQQFVNGGIEKAVENLCKLKTEAFILLGFSVGGYIAWKASLNGLRTNNIFAVSSTRVRIESIKPTANIHLFFGKNDAYKPTEDWFDSLNIKKQLIENEGHEFYKNPAFAKNLIKEILLQTENQTS